ncbi:MAG: endonuclease/exonuclease/phosphatase family protein [Pseudomonadota bacterium]
MRVMCLNGWGGTLHEELLPFLRQAQPEVLCLQEVVHTPQSTESWLTYRDGAHVLPQRANFFDDVSDALHDHAATFCPAALGTLWNEASEVRSQWGLATFVHRALPVVGQVQEFVHKTFSAHGYGAHPRSRSAHAVRLYDLERGRFVSVTHMHGLRDLAGKMDTPARAEQARRLLALSEAVSAPGDLRVICGDFNVEPGSETLRLLRAAGFTELVTRHGIEGTRTSHYKKPGRFADYMLIDDESAVRDFQVIRTPEVSDHCPLLLEL